MMRSEIVCATVVVTVSVGLPANVYGELEDDVRASLEATRQVLVVGDGALGGPGGEWLLARARDARFTLIGENHMTAETPAFADALLRGVHDAGYSKYIVECGPVATKIFSRSLTEDGIEATERLLTENAFGIAFMDQREEMRTAKAALDMGYDVWGVDQEFIGSPRLLLGELASLAADDASRELAQSMLDRAVAGFQHFATTGDQSQAFIAAATDDDYDALMSSFADEGGVALQAIEQLRESAAVYRAYNEGRYYDNNSTRIDLMKRNLLAHLDENDLSPLGDWKAVFKAGTYHMGKGLTPMHVLDVGNFASELAIASGSESFHIMVTARGKVGADGAVSHWQEEAPHMAAFYELAEEDAPVVFDLRPLRAILTQRGTKSEDMEELQFLALRFDALVLYPRFHQSDALVPMPGR